jgi:hypothetical protein
MFFKVKFAIKPGFEPDGSEEIDKSNIPQMTRLTPRPYCRMIFYFLCLFSSRKWHFLGFRRQPGFFRQSYRPFTYLLSWFVFQYRLCPPVRWGFRPDSAACMALISISNRVIFLRLYKCFCKKNTIKCCTTYFSNKYLKIIIIYAYICVIKHCCKT